MNYNILYIEDLDPASIEEDLERYKLKVKTLNPINFETSLNEIKNKYDAYIMDFRLTAGKGSVDAPTYAATIRTNGKNRKDAPIILITNEDYLPEFENDFTSQNLFDLVLTKQNFRANYDKYTKRIKALIEAYSTIQKEKFNFKNILGMNETDNLDYRFIKKLDNFTNKKDIYGYSRTISNSLIRAIGPLVGLEVLAARLGVDTSCPDYKVLLNKPEFVSCKYTGIMSTAYDRWWFHRISLVWEKICPSSLRRLEAKERVDILNQYFNLNLIPAQPIKNAESTNFWTICHKCKKPLDPIDGYNFNIRQLDEWLEPDYISLNAALENPELQDYLSPLDKKNVIISGEEANESSKEAR